MSPSRALLLVLLPFVLVSCSSTVVTEEERQLSRRRPPVTPTQPTWPDGYSPGFPPPAPGSVPDPGALYPRGHDCTALNALSGTGSPAGAELQRCIDEAPDHAQILLRPGKYRIDRGIEIRKPLHLGTLGLDPQAAPCDVNDQGRCAILLISVPYSTADAADRSHGAIHIESSEVSIDHLVVDGDRGNAVRDVPLLCKGDYRRGLTYNLTLGGADFTMTNSVTRNAPCGTGFEVWNTSHRFKFVRNTVAHNGTHNILMRWADGLTIHGTQDAVIDDNLFVNNTDVDLILGECKRCSIKGNRLFHDDSFAGSSFAALMLHAWPGGSGDYTGSVTSGNVVDCGPKRRCGIGIYIGPDAWYEAPTFGGVVTGNRVANAMSGLNIDSVSGPISVYDNTVTSSGGEYLTGCGVRRYGLFNISPESIPFVDLSQSSATPVFTRESYDLCLPNDWQKDAWSATAGSKVLAGTPYIALSPDATEPATLLANQSLKPGQELRSNDGRFVLAYQGDGNLVLYYGSSALWNSGTAGTLPKQAVMQGDGNLVVYDIADRAVFSTRTFGNPGARLILQNDGNLVIYTTGGSPRWASGTSGY
jgi:hypothetical protein